MRPFMAWLIITHLVAGCSVTPKPGPSTIVPGPIPLATSVCTYGQRFTFYRADVLGDPEEKQVRAHEEVHIEQMGRFSSCLEFHEWFRANKAMAEAEAFCASARASVAPDMTLGGAVLKYGRWLASGYDLGLTEEQAVALIAEFCTEAQL